jgi:rubrerythrin
MKETDKVLGLIHQAIEIEKFGYHFYTSMKPYVKDRNGQKMLSHLAKLEIEHLKWLEEEYRHQLEHMEEFDEVPEPNVSLVAEESIFLVDDRIPDVFSNLDHVGALKYAIDIEKRSIKFYRENMEQSTDDRLRLLFEKLADFEEDHLKILEENVHHLKDAGEWKKHEHK